MGETGEKDREKGREMGETGDSWEKGEIDGKQGREMEKRGERQEK